MPSIADVENAKELQSPDVAGVPPSLPANLTNGHDAIVWHDGTGIWLCMVIRGDIGCALGDVWRQSPECPWMPFRGGRLASRDVLNASVMIERIFGDSDESDMSQRLRTLFYRAVDFRQGHVPGVPASVYEVGSDLKTPVLESQSPDRSPEDDLTLAFRGHSDLVQQSLVGLCGIVLLAVGALFSLQDVGLARGILAVAMMLAGMFVVAISKKSVDGSRGG